MDNPKVKTAIKVLKLAMAAVTILTAVSEIKDTLAPTGTPDTPNTDPAPEA
jgi:hypothetical protein